MKKYLTNCRIIYPDTIKKGTVCIENGRIIETGPEVEIDNASEVWDLEGRYVSPGFVEIHTHGAGGSDFMDGTVEAFEIAAKTHLIHGTTTMYPTVLAASKEEILHTIKIFKEAKKGIVKGPKLEGLHMEGPYLNPEQNGAINEKYIRKPQKEEYEEFLDEGKGLISRWTLAPEIEGAEDFVRTLVNAKILPSMGHSNAEYSEVQRGFHWGMKHVTHLYSAMSSMVRREGFRYPGLIESAFCIRDLTVELIADGCHLPIEILKMVYQIKGADKIALTCDSMRCAGQNVKQSFLGNEKSGIPVLIEDGVAKLLDRSAFAGSIATDDRLVRTMYHRVGIPLEDCVKMMTLTPASIMGIEKEVGSISMGKRADLICFDEDIHIKTVLINGEVVYG